MKLAFQIILLLQLVVFGTSGFSVVKFNAQNNGEGFVSIVMSAVEQGADADNAIRPSVLLTSVERSRDRRRTFVADKICYSQNVSLASLSVSGLEKFYDTLVSIPNNTFFNVINNYTEYVIPRQDLTRCNIVLLI